MTRRASAVAVLVGVLLAVTAGATPGDSAGQFRQAAGPTKLACPAGATLDPVFGTCLTCPRGYRLTGGLAGVLPCERPGSVSELPARIYKPGTGLLGTDCPKGQLWDPKGCYACPPGHTRNFNPVTHPKACTGVTLPSFVAARTTNACPAGAFRDLGRGDCWSCGGWHRTAAAVDTPNACSSDVVGMLGVSPRSICSDLVAVVEQGADAAGRVQGVIDNLLSPVLTPIKTAANDVARSIQTPAAFDKLFAGAGAALRPHAALFEEVLRVSERADRARQRLMQVLFDPVVACDGNVAPLDRELLALGLRPSAARDADAPAGLALNLLRRPRPPQTRHLFYALAAEGSLISPYFAKGVASLTVVTDLAGNGGVLWSGGLGAGAKEPKGLELGVTLLFLPNALLDDFVGVQTFGVQVDAGLGGPAAVLFRKLRLLAGGSGAQVQPSRAVPALAFTFDFVTLVTTRQLRFGIGPSWTLLKGSWPKGPPSVGGEIGLKGGGTPPGVGAVGGEVGVKGTPVPPPPPSAWPSFGFSVDGSVLFPQWRKGL